MIAIGFFTLGIGELHSLSTRLRCTGLEYTEENDNKNSRLVATTKFQQRSYSMQQESSPLHNDSAHSHDANKLFELSINNHLVSWQKTKLS